MKKLIYIVVLSLFGLQSCKKDSFEYLNYQPKGTDINAVYFSPGSSSLIADGKASLQFVLEAYRKVQIKSATGEMKDTIMFVDYKALPASDVQIFADGKQVSGMEFNTTEKTKTSIDFYAQIGSVKSAVKTVQLRNPQVLAEKRYVDVVFHVFELENTDRTYDPLTYQSVTQQQLEEAIAYANVVFSNKIGRDPNGANAQIEFRLAKTGPTGALLANPGYNRILYTSAWSVSGYYSVLDFSAKINSQPAYQWNKDKYLNIYLLPLAASNNLGNNRADYQLVSGGGQPIEGIMHVVNSEAEVPANDFYTVYGLGVHRNIFFPGMDSKIELAGYLGVYYGLYRTTLANDFVADTRKYLIANNSLNSLLKIGIDGEKFLADNALDDIRYPSLRNSFTLGQVERMRLVMERSPVRKAWKSE